MSENEALEERIKLLENLVFEMMVHLHLGNQHGAVPDTVNALLSQLHVDTDYIEQAVVAWHEKKAAERRSAT